MSRQKPTFTSKDIKYGIKSKIIMGFSIIVSLFLIAFIAILFVGNKNVRYSNLIANEYLPVQVKIFDVQTTVAKINTSFVSYMLTGRNEFKQSMDQSYNNLDRIIFNIKSINTFETDKEKDVWDNIINSINNVRQVQKDMINQFSTLKSTPDSLNQMLVTRYLPEMTNLNNFLNNDNDAGNINSNTAGFFDIQTEVVQNGINDLVVQTKLFQLFSAILIIFSIGLAIFISLYVSNRITNPLNKAINAARDIASGERNIKLVSETRDETGILIDSLSDMQEAIMQGEQQLQQKEIETRELYARIVESAKDISKHCAKVSEGDLRGRLGVDVLGDDIMKKLGVDLNSMTDSLTNITSQITNASHDIVTTLEEVRHSVDVQSSGASEQASSINEITASLEEIEKSTAQTADKAKALGEAAIKTQEKGRLGVESVEESIRGMRLVRDKVQLIAQTIMELSSQTQQVGEITAVVNNLAQQSKMLALNASIEAAKAGEAGKGFAVVASEVKNLAEQSEQSTSQVQKILEDIRKATERAVMVTEEGTKGVDYGTSLIEKTGELVISLNDVIREATIASQQIEAAISQECVGVEQITVGMNEINQVTTSFVESARQTTEAISNLSDIARDLKSNVDSYKV